MVPVTLKLLSRSLVLISVIFITSLPQFFRGVCSSPRKIGDPREFSQFVAPQKYGDLNPVLRRAKFVDANNFDDAGHVEGIKKRDSHPIIVPALSSILDPTPSSSLLPIRGSTKPIENSPSTGEETQTPQDSISPSEFIILSTRSFTRVTQPTPAPSSQLSRNTLADKHSTSTSSATSPDAEHTLPTTPLVTPTPNQVDKHPDKNSLRVGATVGGVLGGLVLISLIGACICISRRRRKGRRGNLTASSRPSHNSFGPVEWHARLDDTSHPPEVEKNEDLSYRNRDSDHFGSGVESNFFPRRAITYMRGRRQRFMSYLTRGMAESGVDGDRSASDADEGIPNFGSQITLINDRTQQLEMQEQVRQDSVNSPVSRPPTYRSSPSRYSFDINNPILRPPTYHSSPSRYSLDTTAFVMHRISLPSVEMNSVIKT